MDVIVIGPGMQWVRGWRRSVMNDSAGAEHDRTLDEVNQHAELVEHENHGGPVIDQLVHRGRERVLA